MAARSKKTPEAPAGTPLRGEAAWAAAKKKVADANQVGYAQDRAKRDISEARAAQQRIENARLEDADLHRRS